MKKTKSNSIDHYIASYPAEQQKFLEEMRNIISSVAPGAEETIKYGIPTYVWYGNLVHFGAAKEHTGFYPGPSAIKVFSSELSSYPQSKGAVRFPHDKRLPVGLIKKIVKFRMKENREKISRKVSKK